MRSFAVGFRLATRRAGCSCFSSADSTFVTSLTATLNVTLESGIDFVGGITLTNDSTLPRNRRCKTEARFHCDPSFHRPHRFRSVGSAGTRPGESEPRAISQRTQKICSSSRHLSRRCPNRKRRDGSFASRTTATGFRGLRTQPSVRDWNGIRLRPGPFNRRAQSDYQYRSGNVL